jgi:ketosteroid isomerase-like protein
MAAASVELIGGRWSMDRTRKLRRELSYGIAKLRALEESVDPAVDDAGAKALATQIRQQAGVCLGILDQYQLAVPGRMWTYAETKCRPLRDDLKRTELLFRDASGEFARRSEVRPYVHQTPDWMWGDVYESDDDLRRGESGADSGADDQPIRAEEVSPVELSDRFFDAHNRQDLDGLMELVDDDVEFKRAFDPALKGKAAVREQYEKDWADHKNEIVYVTEVFEAEGKIAIEIQVDSGPPSNLVYNGVVVHDWNEEGRLARSQLYVDEVASEEGGSSG